MQITVTQTLEIDESTLSDTPANVGLDMLNCALNEWYGYDENGTFEVIVVDDNGTKVYTVCDTDEAAVVSFTALEFFKKHVELIWLGGIENFRHDWIEFAFKSHGADADENDAITCDAVLQTMLYGKIVYG